MNVNTKYHNGFLNDGIANYCDQFIPCDSKLTFHKNLKLTPEDWVYRKLPVEYKYNSLAFRCEEHTSLKDDYILFSGCSFTEGVGLKLETSYPYVVANELGTTYYNLALGGTGPSVVTHNMKMFLSLMQHKLPKVVVIQWPSFYRFSLMGSDGCKFLSPQTDLQSCYKELMTNELIYPTNAFNRISLLKYLSNLGINNIIELGLNVSHKESEPDYTKKAQWRLDSFVDFARDLGHPGIQANRNQAEEILRII